MVSEAFLMIGFKIILITENNLSIIMFCQAEAK